MEYNLIVNQEKKSIDAIIMDQAISMKTGNTVYDATFVTLSEHQILLNINGQNINAFICSDNGTTTVIINGQSYEIQDADLLEQNLPNKTGPLNTATIVASPMPAVVISILTRVGDRVKKGQKLIIVSAMKMETTLIAPYSGMVANINTKEGDKVMPADILVDIDKEGDK